MDKKLKLFWDMANKFRSVINIHDYKNYILSLFFYKYLSDECSFYLKEKLSKDEIIDKIGYYLEPTELISNLKKRNVSFISMELQNIFSHIEESMQDNLKNIFSHIDLSSSKLGRSIKDRELLLQELLSLINKFKDSEIATVFEESLTVFSQSEGRRAVEISIPSEISTLLAKLVTSQRDNISSVYDPTCGSASLLLKMKEESKVSNFYGQEINIKTHNIARMNMIVHGVNYKDFDIQLGDVLKNPKHLDKKFDIIIGNPPFGLRWSADLKFLEDKRFSEYEKLPPKSKADFAFIQHMLYHLDENGTMAVIMPIGVLFRGGSERYLREYLIKNKNYIDTVIGLPSNLFYSTSIPTCILILKKNRQDKNILFIDASNHYIKSKNQNYLTEEHIDKIITAYQNRVNIKSYSRVVSLQEVEKNDYNLHVTNGYVKYSNSLKKLHIKNFKSIVDVEINNIPSFSVFAGSNGSGKSNIFEALEFIRDIVRYGATEAIKKHNGYLNISSHRLKGKNRKTFMAEMEVRIASNLYRYKLTIENLDTEPILYEILHKDGNEIAKKIKDKNESKIIIHERERFLSYSKDETILKLISDESEGLLEFLSAIERYQIDPVKAKDADDYSSTNETLDAYASNLSTVLKRFEKDKSIFEDIMESMQIIVPEFEKFSIETDKYTNKSILLFKEESGRNKFPSGLISDGTIYALAMLTIIHSNTKGIILIEEPERGLNPKAISELVELFRTKSEDVNIFINTHSETIVRDSKPDELFLVAKENGKTETKNVKESFPNYDYSTMDIDKMWLCNMFDGGLPW